VLAGRRALGAIAIVAMAAGCPQAPAEELRVPQVSTGEDSRAKPADDGNVKPAPAQSPAQSPAQGTPPAEDTGPKSRLVSILGREITNREGDNGRVIDVLVDLDGRSGAVVVEFGGFLGIGSRKIAVEWSALRFVREGNRSHLTIDVSREQIRDTPEYKANEPPAVLTTQDKMK
jgi:PRC-barrel domain protein